MSDVRPQGPERSFKPHKITDIKLNEADVEFVEQQLGRKPRGIIEISARCKSGHPLVVKTKPVLAESTKLKVESNLEVFPTLYYLVCGSMVEKVFQLESEGLITELQGKVDNEQAFRNYLLAAQSRYREHRNSLVGKIFLTESQRESLESGIGGVKKTSRIKCLHAHFAHYLATGDNVVGEAVARRVGFSC